MSPRTLARHPLTLLALGLLVLPAAVHAIGMTNVAATKLALFVLVGLGFNVLLGYTGQVSFGHAMFFGLGAYAAALFQIHLAPQGFWLPILVALAFNLVMGIVIGFLILRRRGVYFALLTLAFSAMWFSIIYRWTDFTGGENGLRGVGRPATLGLDPDADLVFYYLVAGIVFAGGILLWRLVNSPVGRVFQAIRENEQRCRFLGYRVTIYKLIAFTVSALFVSLPGSLYAYLLYFVSADLVSVPFSGEILAMSIIGGSGYFLGPPVGAIFYIVFQEWLSAFTASWQLWFGVLFAGIIFFSPDGLLGIGDRVTAPFRKSTGGAMEKRVTPALGPVPDFLRMQPGHGTLLRAEGLHISFGPVHAVRGVDFSLHHGELKIVIGPNGAGKTSLFNLLSGMFPPDAGTIRFEGHPIQGLPTADFPRLGISRSFQITNLFERLTIAQNMRLAVQAMHGARYNPWRHADAIDVVERETAELLSFIGLRGMEDVKVADLSGGGKRLLEIGLSLASKPRALLLDEPLAGLAAAERERIVQLVHALSEHMAVLMVEHDIDRAFAIGRHITVMHDGEILADGTAEEVRAHPDVQRVYLGQGAAGAPARRTAQVPGEVLLRVDKINTFYGSSHILHDVSLDLRSGEIVGLLGRNGAGKSTVIKTVMGLARPRSGRITLDGVEVAGLGPEKLGRLGIGYVPQGRRLFNNLSVAANIRLGRLQRRTGVGASWSDADIERFFPRLPTLYGRKAGVLSGGEKQMVAIARALVGDVRLLMLDEPFEGLAPAVIDELSEAISALREQVPVLIVEHDLDRVLALADRVYVLDRGTVTYEGPAAPLLEDLDYRKQVLWV
ncbi:MAG: ATP-binding cassette domain-containing protein [Dichotomicrobium sp.]